jgi:hypothetical protein
MKLPPMSTHEQQQQQQLLDGRVQSLAWSLDGYALSVGFLGRGGLAVWSVYGALLCSMNDAEELIDHDLDHLQDTYIHQINHMVKEKKRGWGHKTYIVIHRRILVMCVVLGSWEPSVVYLGQRRYPSKPSVYTSLCQIRPDFLP